MGRPLPIDHRPTIVANRDRIVNLARKVAPLVDEIIDVDMFCARVMEYGSSNNISPKEIVRAVNLFFLLELGYDHSSELLGRNAVPEIEVH